MNDATTPDDSGTPGLGLGLPQRGSNYRVLARKYRPASFADLIGQEAMVRTISNAFESGRIRYPLEGAARVERAPDPARVCCRRARCAGIDSIPERI